MNKTKRKILYKAIGLLILIAISSGVIIGGNKYKDYTPLIEKYKKIIKEEMLKYKVAGLSIAIVDKDSIVWCEGFGNYNYKNILPVTGHTPFNIGSISKIFTGLAVMQLQEDRIINIDESYKKYVPEFSMKSLFGKNDDIKIRDILTHHAGIPENIKDKFSTKPLYFTHILESVNEDYATFPPRTVFSYSNTGFSILGNLIEKASGDKYYDFIKRRIFDPIEMNESGFFTDEKVPLSVSLGYNLQGDECKELSIYDSPAGCIYSSAYDMAKFIKLNLNWGKYDKVQVFDSLTLSKMMQIQNRDTFLDFQSPYGLAWRIYFTDGGLSIQHDGGTMYHRAELSIAPFAGIGVVMLSNSSSGKPLLHVDYDIMNEAINIKGFNNPAKAETLSKNTKHPEHEFKYSSNNKNIMIYALDSVKSRTLCGVYGSFGLLCKIMDKSNALCVNMNGNQFYLFPVGNDEFVAASQNNHDDVDSTNRFYFEDYGNNKMFMQIDRYGNHKILAGKINSYSISPTWMNRLGDYSADGKEVFQMFTNFKLIMKEGVICLTAKFNLEMPEAPGNEVIAPLEVIDDGLARIVGYGRFSGQVIRFNTTFSGNIEMLFMGFGCKKR